MTHSPSLPDSTSRRRGALLWLTSLIAVVALACALYWVLVLRDQESTDNAYVQAPVVQVTAQVDGTVLAVLADDTDRVRAGQALVRLDASDASLALARAQAQLAQTVREVRTLYANNGALDAAVHLRQAEVARALSDLARAGDDVQRRLPLVASGAIGGEEMKHAESAQASAGSALAGAQSALAAAREQAASNRALTEGVSAARHPSVERAAAGVREAYLALQRAEVPAPVAGQVARRTVQAGQRIARGTPLMSVIPLEQGWVDANFKESQLRRMRVGQPVRLSSDLYGHQVEYRGRVAGLGAGTGAAFALLPAQNATGNWVKVVQRIAVRIELEPAQLAEHPLRVGLSMEAVVDVSQTGGAPLLGGAAPRVSSHTEVFEARDQEAQKRVDEIIARNLGAPSKPDVPLRARPARAAAAP